MVAAELIVAHDLAEEGVAQAANHPSRFECGVVNCIEPHSSLAYTPPLHQRFRRLDSQHPLTTELHNTVKVQHLILLQSKGVVHIHGDTRIVRRTDPSKLDMKLQSFLFQENVESRVGLYSLPSEE